MKIPGFAIRNYQFTIMVSVLLMIMGISSFFTMPQSENPTIYVPGGSVYIIYPGANPQDLEQLVAFPIEEALNELDDIKMIQTELKDGIAVISVEFSYNTDAEEKFDEVVEQVNSVRNSLPSEIVYLDVMQWTSGDIAMIQLAFISDSLPFSDMENQAERLKRDLERIGGVKKVEIIALPEQEIRISLDMEKMAEMNISITQVEQAIQSNNANIPGDQSSWKEKTLELKQVGPIKTWMRSGIPSFNLIWVN